MGRYRNTDADTPLHIVDNTDIFTAGTELGGEESCCIRIGRDIMGTMANTLVLAYAGSSLCSTLLNITYSSSLMELLNREGVAVELLQSLVGSMAILLTIPLTSIVCSFLYTKHEGKAHK